MNSVQTVVSQTSPPRKSFLYDPKVRGIFYQVVLVAAVVYLFYMAATNAIPIAAHPACPQMKSVVTTIRL